METSYIPVRLYPGMTADMIQKDGLYSTMQSFNIIPERAVETLTAVPISLEDALLLNVAPLAWPYATSAPHFLRRLSLNIPPR